MKKLSTIIFLLTITLSFKAIASIAFDVQGKIKVSNLSSDKAQFKLVSLGREFTLVDVDLKDIPCKDGVFTIVSNYAPINTYSLLETVRCQSQAMSISNNKDNLLDSDPTVCPEIYSPVCAQPKMPACKSGTTCIQLMPSPKTYGNRCEMKRDGATFLLKGECENLQTLNAMPIGLWNKERRDLSL